VAMPPQPTVITIGKASAHFHMLFSGCSRSLSIVSLACDRRWGRCRLQRLRSGAVMRLIPSFRAPPSSTPARPCVLSLHFPSCSQAVFDNSKSAT
jgi:hypothetical protein